MSTLSNNRRTNAMKFIYAWQNTGNQILKLKESESDKPDAHKSYNDIHTTCPFKCGSLDTPLHYLYCISPLAQQFSTTLLTSIQDMLKKEHTALPLYNAIVDNLQHHIQ